MSYIRMKLTVLSLLLLSVFSCSYAQKGNELPAKEFAKAIESNTNAQVIDVRTPEEFEEGAIGDAININWYDDNFGEQIATIDKNQPVYVYCRSGKRSAEAARYMRKAGFKNVYELKGGIEDWERAQLLEEKDDE